VGARKRGEWDRGKKLSFRLMFGAAKHIWEIMRDLR